MEKKIIFLMLAFIMFFSILKVSAETTNGTGGTCTDFGNGEVGFIGPGGGTTTTNGEIYTYDSCISDSVLQKNYCNGDGSMGTRQVICPAGKVCSIYDGPASSCYDSSLFAINQTNGGGQGSNGGTGSTGSCARYYTCPNGTQINYCSIVTSGNGAGCGCSSNPASLCNAPSGGGGGGLGVNNSYTCSINEDKVNITEVTSIGVLRTSASNFCFNFPTNVPDGTTVLQLTRLAISNNISLATIYQNRTSGQYLMQVTCDYVTSNDTRIYKLATSVNCPNGCANGVCIGSNGGSGGSSSGSGSSGGGGSGSSSSGGSSGGGGGSNSCSNGCTLSNVCVSVGYRTTDSYCDITKNFTQFKSINAQCNNDFECSSNFCISNQCISPNVLQRIIKWFTRLFGG